MSSQPIIRLVSKKRSTSSEDGSNYDRKVHRIQRKWVPAESKAILEYLKNTIQANKAIEKPTAVVYYSKMLSKVCFTDCSVSQMKNKVKNMKDGYLKTLKWRSQAGQDILEKEGIEELEKQTVVRCPFYKEMEDVFGIQMMLTNDDDLRPRKLCPRKSRPYNVDIRPKPDRVNTITLLGPFVCDPKRYQTQQNDLEKVDSPVENSGTESDMVPVITQIRGLSSPDEDVSAAESDPATRVNDLKQLLDDKNQRISLEAKKMDLEIQKLEFEKEKWEFQKTIRLREMELEERKVAEECSNARYDIEMKYKTQLEIAKLSST